MPRINGDIQNSVFSQQVDRRLDGGHRSLSHRRNRLIAAGQPTQIKHPRLDRLFHIVFYQMVRRVDQGVILRTALLAQTRPRRFHRRLLNIESVYATALTHRFGKKYGVVSVAHREIDGDVALFQMAGDKGFMQFQQIKHFSALSSPFFVYCLLWISERRKRIVRSTASLESYQGSDS